MPVWSISDTLKFVFKVALFSTFTVALISFSVWFLGFMGDIYALVGNATGSLLNNDLPELLGCILHALGIDDFITSAFAIFFSAATFWLTAVAYIMSYKLGFKVYDGLFKVAS